MNASLLRVEPLNLDSVRAQVGEDGVLRLTGTISMRSPSDTLKPFFERVHGAVVRDGSSELVVDIGALSFMNSSSIRVLISWLDWIGALPPEKRYVLHFRTNPSATWQQTTLGVLKSLAEDHVRITPAQ